MNTAAPDLSFLGKLLKGGDDAPAPLTQPPASSPPTILPTTPAPVPAPVTRSPVWTPAPGFSARQRSTLADIPDIDTSPFSIGRGPTVADIVSRAAPLPPPPVQLPGGPVRGSVGTALGNVAREGARAGVFGIGGVGAGLAENVFKPIEFGAEFFSGVVGRERDFPTVTFGEDVDDPSFQIGRAIGGLPRRLLP